MARAKAKIAVIDCETDPFLHGRIPEPFCVEFYTDGIAQEFWGNDCIEKMVNFLESLDDEYLIFAHNGGKFDFHFFAKYLDNPIKVINARIVRARIFQHTFQDSYAIMPIPLRDYNKMEFDYSLLERPVREKNKRIILEYLHSDCVNLYNWVNAFVDRFGRQLTVGSTAIKELRKRHPFDRLSSAHDAYLRQYYYGGRVQCFQSGVLRGPWKMYDVNSMYPKAMRDFLHPVNGLFERTDEIPDDPSQVYFAKFRGKNNNALPVKTKTGLRFDVPEGIFTACSHEINMALKYGLIEIDEVLECCVSLDNETFATFVDEFYADKVNCKKAGDKTGEIFAKFMLNSAYGKFGQNPENFDDWKIVRDIDEETALIERGFEQRADFDEFTLWSCHREPKEEDYYNVSTAASITSAARAILLEGLQHCDTPIYCDTDSLICKDFRGEISDTVLGAWKFEKETMFSAIAGKKLYALYDDPGRKPAKLVTKGGSISLSDMISICEGGMVEYYNDAPTFSLTRNPTFVARKFKSTIDDKPKLGL